MIKCRKLIRWCYYKLCSTKTVVVHIWKKQQTSRLSISVSDYMSIWNWTVFWQDNALFPSKLCDSVFWFKKKKKKLYNFTYWNEDSCPNESASTSWKIWFIPHLWNAVILLLRHRLARRALEDSTQETESEFWIFEMADFHLWKAGFCNVVILEVGILSVWTVL